MSQIALTRGELYIGAAVGVMRRLAAMKRERPEPKRGWWGEDEGVPHWQIDIEGACAELAAAKALGVYWKNPLIDHVGGSDDLEGLGIRSTRHPQGGLTIYTSDPDDRPFVLVRGKAGQYDLVGWAYGRDGKRQDYWRPDFRQPAYVIPGDQLQPLASLCVTVPRWDL
jgi:hypothetical protein